MEKKNNKNIKNKQMSTSYSWTPKTEKSGVTVNRVFLGLRKFTATM
jgi:hypothetical protein